MKVKRIASFAIACIMILVISFQPVAYAQVNSKTYNPVIITIPSKGGNVEQSFREFVKDVSDMYFLEGYDLNKYYYRASEIKNQWDKSFFVKNNPYSTYEFAGPLAEYNEHAILDSLIEGLKKKVDRMAEISIDEYYIGFTFNTETGLWEYDHVKALDQEIYNEQINAAIEQTRIDAYSNMCNAVADLSAAFIFKGNAPDWFSDLANALFSIVSETLKSRANALHENVSAVLRNELRDAVEQAFLKVNADLDGQLLEALRIERYSFDVTTANDDEKMRHKQVEYLLDAIDEANDETLNNNIKTAAENAADALMDKVGLEVHTALSPEEINKVMFHDFAVACVKELTKWLISALECSDVPEAILQSATASTVQMVADMLDEDAVESRDYNGDGAYDEFDIVLSVIEYYFTRENLTSVANAFFQSLIQSGLKEDLKNLELLYLNRLLNWDNVCKNYLSELTPIPAKEYNKMVEEIGQAKETLTKSGQMLDEIKRQARTYNMGSVKELLSDTISLCSDLLQEAKDLASMGDVVDSEVFFASLACSMYHTMERAEGMRSIIKSKYSSYKNHSAIDNADIKELKDFVNCVYSVFELDKTGHKYYMDLLAGWEYQHSGKRLEEGKDIMMEHYMNVIDTYGGWGNVMIVIAGPAMNTIYYWIEVAESEYLQEVDAKGGWIDAAKTVATYLQISNCANQAEMPAVYSGLFIQDFN